MLGDISGVDHVYLFCEATAQRAEQLEKINWLMEQLRLLRHKTFAPKSEKSPFTPMTVEQLSFLDVFKEAEACADERCS